MQIKIELEIGVSAALMALIEMASRGDYGDRVPAPTKQPLVTSPKQAVEQAPVAGETVEAGTNEEVDTDAPDVDAAGWPWDAALHASTKGTTKDGLWRMKIGVTRPEPKPGFPKSEAAATMSATGKESKPSDAAPVAEPVVEDEDEFAAFRAAADNANATDTKAVAEAPARKWIDADLGALCNQAAVKLGDPAPVKAIIAEFVPADSVPHSRNIVEDRREAFAAAIEAKAGIEFAG